MKFFSLDSPFVSFMNKVADLMWLNILTMVCCIPVFTIGASFTALHYVALKIVRGEESYITRNFFKSFKQNFKQATLIWLILLLLVVIIVGDLAILGMTEIKVPTFVNIIILAAIVALVLTATTVFPLLAKFDNTIKRTFINALLLSILHFPKTLMMILLSLLPIVVAMVSMGMLPLVFLFCFSFPAWLSAILYNKVFEKMEEQIRTANGEEESVTDEEEDVRIFKDELEEIPGLGENVDK